MKLKSILYILMLLPFLWSCNNEDDVEEIFASGTWHVVDFYGKANWDKRNGEPKYNAMARMVLLQEAYKMEPLKAHGKRTEKTGQ